MTILYISNETFKKTLFFKEPIKSFSKMRLVDCRFINKVCNLPELGTIWDENNVVLTSFIKGNYTVDGIITSLNVINKGFTIVLMGEKYMLVTNKTLKLSGSMAKFFGISKIVKKPGPAVEIFIKPILGEIYINADIVDSNDVYSDGAKSKIFSSIFLNASEKTNYSPNVLYTKTISADYLTSINLWVTDHENKVIDKSLYEICACLEII